MPKMGMKNGQFLKKKLLQTYKNLREKNAQPMKKTLSKFGVPVERKFQKTNKEA